MWLSMLGMWMLVLTIVSPGRPPYVHQVRQFATEEACETFRQQLEHAYSQAERTVGTVYREQGQRPPPRPQRLYECAERATP